MSRFRVKFLEILTSLSLFYRASIWGRWRRHGAGCAWHSLEQAQVTGLVHTERVPKAKGMNKKLQGHLNQQKIQGENYFIFYQSF